MKKLLIAAALTASVCSFGANINAEKFDAAAVGTKPADIKEAAGEEFVNYFKADGGDASAVAAYAENTASEKTTEAGAAGANYLNLSTEGSTLWRTINPYTFETSTTTENDKEVTTTNETTTAKAVAETGTYIDTLVQFTATEDETNIDVDDAKLAMWLLKTGEGEDATYALKVKGSAVALDDYGAEMATPTVYQLNASVEPSTWYRLTVKTVKIFEEATYLQNGYGFAVYIDGAPIAVVSGQKVFSDAALEALSTGDSKYLSASVKAALAENKLIPSIGVLTAETDIYGVGFKGTGAIDSIAWTDKDIYPFSAPSGAFTLTITMNEGIDAVQYAIGTADPVTYTAPVEVKEGDVVTITATPKDWWVAPKIDPITVDGDEEVDVNATAVTTSDITFADTSVPTGDAGAKALAWAKKEGKTTDDVKAAKYFYSDYLLGFTDFSTAEPTIEIVSIEFDANGKPVVEAKVTVGDVTKIEKLSEATTLNGTLMYKAAATLEALKDATPKAAIADGDQFIQVVVE
jgi:hypothetical protein